MKILSDTQGAHRRMGELPEECVLVHSGDFTMTGTEAHLFGHIHKSHGIERIGSTIYSNAAIMNEDYTHLQLPNLIEI